MSDVPILPDDKSSSTPSTDTLRGGDPATLGRIDHYDLLRKLGGGGFGVVYLARDTVSGVEVALKTLHPLLKRNDEEMDLLREKFRLVHGLTHPNIAKALVIHLVREINVWDDDARAELKLSPGDSVMVMDYAPGVTLSKWRRQFPDGVVPFDLALEVGRQVAAALDYAHGERIVHRDVKPGNIMVETVAAEPRPLDHGQGAARSLIAPTLRVRILDFGLAAEIRSSMSRVSTESGDTSGTRPYMAPEQWLGRKQDGQTDQYALACVLYELLSGAPPFAGVFETGDPMIMMATVKGETPDEIEGLAPAANAALLRALAKDPATRFPTCTAFVEALCQGRGVSTIRPPRHAGWIAAAAAALLAVGALWFAQPGGDDPGGASRPGEPPRRGESRAEPAESAEGRALSPIAPSQESQGTQGSQSAPSLPPEGASRAELEDAVAQLMARRDALEPYDPGREPLQTAIDGLQSRIDEARAAENRAAREAEKAGRRAVAQREVDLADLSDLKKAVERRVSSLDGTWKDGEFAKRRTAIAEAQKKLALCKDASYLAKAKELRGDIYDAADWIERNTPARNNLTAQEAALDALAKACAAADAATLASASLRKAERARKEAEKNRDAGNFEDAATGYVSAKTLYETARDEARGAKAAAAVEEAGTYEKAKRWDKCLAAAEKALEWDSANADAKRLKAAAESELKKIADAKEAAERKAAAKGGASRPGEPKTAGERYVATVAGLSVPLRWCPARSFTMGSPTGEGGRWGGETQHCVTLSKGFYLGETEVTQGLWKKVMGGNNPSSFKSGDDYPVESVSWNDCQDFLRKLNAQAPVAGFEWRLPTEAQWEYACRAETTTAYFWGNALNGDKANCDGNYPCGTSTKGPYKQKTTKVGSYAANPWGLYDMHGNVWEWCADWYGAYPSDDATDPTGPQAGVDRVCRGGSWDDVARYCRSAFRARFEPGFRHGYLGFRVALAPVLER